MAIAWNDPETPETDEEDLTEIEYSKRPSRVLIHDEITSALPETPEALRPASPFSPSPFSRKTPALAESAQAEPRASALQTPAALLSGAASLRDRLAAFLVDALVLFYLHWAAAYLLLKIFKLPNLMLLHLTHTRLALHWTLTLTLGFLYYFLAEGLAGATLGKFVCRLQILNEKGGRASWGSIFIRNLLRLIDYAFFFLVAAVSLETSPLHQRLGDRAAHTIIVKKKGRYRLPVVDLTQTPLASAFSRLVAGGIDLLLSLSLVYGIFSLLRPGYPFLNQLVSMSLPAIFVLYYTLPEVFTGTTPGKLLFKRQVVLQHGEALDSSSALLRNFFRPLDCLIGYPLMLIGACKQRLGDIAAETVVVAQPSRQKAYLVSLATVVLVSGTAYLGLTNKNSLLRRQYGLSPLQGLRLFVPAWLPLPQPLKSKLRAPVQTTPGDKPAARPAASPVAASPLPKPPETPQAQAQTRLTLSEFYFATGHNPSEIRSDGLFRSGDLIFTFFKVEGFATRGEDEASFSEDLQVEDASGKKVLSQKEIVKLDKRLDAQNPSVLFANQIKLPQDMPAGKYRAIFTIYDQVAKTQLVFEKFFELQ